MPDLRHVIAQAVRAERMRLGITQDDLAGTLGWTRTVVTMVEQGDRTVGAHELPALCRSLDVTLGQLLRDADRADRQALGI